MRKLRLPWRAKHADSKHLPKVERITGKMGTCWGKGTVVLPGPIKVNEIQLFLTEQSGRSNEFHAYEYVYSHQP